MGIFADYQPILVRGKRGRQDVALTVDWDRDGGYWGPFEDLSPDLLALDVERGLSEAFGSVVAGSLTAELDNRENVYSVESPSSPIAKQLRPYRDAQVRLIVEEKVATDQGAAFVGALGDRIDVPDAASLRSASFTIEFWVKPDVRRVQGFVSKVHPIVEVWRVFMSDTDGKVQADRFPTGGGVISQETLPLAMWSHIAFAYDSLAQFARLFIDGRLSASASGLATFGGATVADFIRFSSGEVNHLDGALDEVRLWKVARSQVQIQADMRNEVVASHPDLMGYWRLNDAATSTIADDATPNNNDGTLVGGVSFVAGAGLVKDLVREVMTGKAMQYVAHERERDLKEATLGGTDAFTLLGAEVRIDTIQNTTTKVIAGSVLDKAGIGTAKRIIDVGDGDAITVAFGERRSAQAWLDALGLFGYTQAIDRLGRYVLRGRVGQTRQANVGTITAAEAVDLTTDEEGLTTRIKVVAHPWLIATVDEIIWASGFLPFDLQVGEERTINAVFQDQATLRNEGVVSVVTPVATTDYLANQAPAGPDRTAFLTVTLVGSPSTSMDMKVKNTHASDVLRVTKLQLRGKPADPLNPETVERKTGAVDFPDLFREVDSDLIQTRPIAETVADYLASRFGDPRVRLRLTWEDTEVWDPVAIKADVGDLVTVDLAGGRVKKVQAQLRGVSLQVRGRSLAYTVTLDRFGGVLENPPLLESWDEQL